MHYLEQLTLYIYATYIDPIRVAATLQLFLRRELKVRPLELK